MNQSLYHILDLKNYQKFDVGIKMVDKSFNSSSTSTSTPTDTFKKKLKPLVTEEYDLE